MTAARRALLLCGRAGVVVGLSIGTLLVAGAVWAFAQTPAAVSPPVVELSPRTATVGDKLTLTITVEHDAAVAVMAPGFGTDFGGLELISKSPPTDAAAAGGRTTTTFTYSLVAFDAARFTVPGLTMTYTSPDGTGGTVMTEATNVTIASVLTGDDTALRPLKPQLGIDDGAPSAAVPVIFVGGFALLTAAGYVLHRRAAQRPPVDGLMAFSPPLEPDEVARAELNSLAASGLATADPVEYYARLAAILRRYLTGRFGFAAYAMTRRELEMEMRRVGIDPWPARLTVNVLGEADAVQFAGFRPAPERREADLTAAYEIVALTAPEATSAPSEAAVQL